jgi:hypothetical protein
MKAKVQQFHKSTAQSLQSLQSLSRRNIPRLYHAQQFLSTLLQRYCKKGYLAMDFTGIKVYGKGE